MKRETFEIKIKETDEKYYKHKWNAAIRETESLIKTIADKENQTYSLIAYTGERDKRGRYVKGSRTWNSEVGDVVTFLISKIE